MSLERALDWCQSIVKLLVLLTFVLSTLPISPLLQDAIAVILSSINQLFYFYELRVDCGRLIVISFNLGFVTCSFFYYS